MLNSALPYLGGQVVGSLGGPGEELSPLQELSPAFNGAVLVGSYLAGGHGQGPGSYVCLWLGVGG